MGEKQIKKVKTVRLCPICGKDGVRSGRKYCSKKCFGISEKGKTGTNLGRKFSDEWKKKIGDANRGTKHTEQSKRNMSIAHKNQKPRAWTEEEKMKLRKNRRGKCMGENHPRWKGGVWAKNPKEHKRFSCLRRVAIKKKAEGSHTLGEWETLKAQYNWTCPCCGKSEVELKRNLTEDHIIPLSRGGSDNIENIQPLCLGCNCRKHTKVIKYMPR